LDESNAESADASTENPHSENNKPTQTLTKKGKNKSTQGRGSFKENPYTFLSPDDPILLSCM